MWLFVTVFEIEKIGFDIWFQIAAVILSALYVSIIMENYSSIGILLAEKLCRESSISMTVLHYFFKNARIARNLYIPILNIIWNSYSKLPLLSGRYCAILSTCNIARFSKFLEPTRIVDLRASVARFICCFVLLCSTSPPGGNPGWRFTAGLKFKGPCKRSGLIEH